MKLHKFVHPCASASGDALSVFPREFNFEMALGDLLANTGEERELLHLPKLCQNGRFRVTVLWDVKVIF